MKETSITESTRGMIKKHDFKIAKKFGQNFLVDENILSAIIDCSELSKDDCVLEIGPGLGAMTKELCDKAGQVLAVEIDTKLIPILKISLCDYDNFKLINEDILKLNLKSALE